jgi:transcriptional regulator of acetoin/glycerol metabolism
MLNRSIRSRLMLDYAEVNAKETSKAWNRFVSEPGAPSISLTGVRDVIYQSWLRSNSTGIKPEQCAAPTQASTSQARITKHDNSDLRRATQESLMHIGNMLSGAEAILLLTDRDGVILDTVGDTSTLDKANRINLRVGGIWSEEASGTNGIGTAIWAGQPVFVHGEEHFCEGMKAWSCACAPIRDPRSD